MIRKLLAVLCMELLLGAMPAGAQLAGPVLPGFGVTAPGITPRQYCAKTPDGKCYPFMTQDPATGALSLINGGLSYTAANRAGDTMTGPYLFDQTLGLPTASQLDLTYAGTPNPSAIKLGAGNSISFCPSLSCIFTPSDNSNPTPSFFDHQRASALLSAETQDDAHSEEQTLAVTSTIDRGFIKIYAASTAYDVGDNVAVGTEVYRACASASSCGAGKTTTTAGTSGPNSAPPGVKPTAAQGGAARFADGTIVWQWINSTSIAGKVGSYFETNVQPGAGAAWGAAFNYHLKAMPQAGNFFPGIEMDYSNDSGVGCPLGIDCTALRVAVAGSGATQGIYLEGSTTSAPTTIWGIRTAGSNLASTAGIEEDSGSPVGIGLNNGGYGSKAVGSSTVNHAIAGIQDLSNSPVAYFIGGTHTLSGIRESSNSPAGIVLAGSYTIAQLAGTGFTFDPSGGLALSGVGAPNLLIAPAAGGAGTVNKIGIYGAAYGWGVSAGSLDAVVPSNAAHSFYVGSTKTAAIGPNGFRGVLATPASSSAACTAGDFLDDANFHYVCVATNTWKRIALNAF